MASSKVLPTTSSSANPDLPRQPTLCSSLSSLLADLQNHSSNSSDPNSNSNPLSSMNMDDLLKTIYSPPTPPPPPLPRDDVAAKSVDEVWKEIVAGGDQSQAGAAERMTLEDFLTKAGAVTEEDVRGGAGVLSVQVGAVVGSYGVDAGIGTNSNGNNHQSPSNGNYGQIQRFGNGIMTEGGGRVRGKRRAVEEPPVDKATQQKQRRMIKNRESAARSRERKQAYTVELESLVTQLEEEKARLLREKVEEEKERFKQLMENLIPVVEKRRPPRVLRRVHSVQW